MSILVTGGAGFIGSHVANHLLERGERVIVVDEVNDYYDVDIKHANISMLANKSQQEGNGELVFFKGNLCDEKLMQQIYEEENIDRVVHLAARAGVRPSIEDPIIYVKSNVEATTLLLKLSCEFKVKHFVFASSSSVYGGRTDQEFSESDNIDFPVSPYAATKKACELIAYTYHHLYKLNISGLRFFTVYGPRGRPDMAPYKFIERIMNDKPIQQYGDGTSMRDYTYIDDIVQGVIGALDNPLGYQNYNLGRGFPTSLKKFIGIVEDCVGKKAEIELLPDQPGDVPRTCANINKACKQIGYDPQTCFEDGIKKTVEWYRENIYPTKSQSINNGKKSPSLRNLSKQYERSDSVTLHLFDEEGSKMKVSPSDFGAC